MADRKLERRTILDPAVAGLLSDMESRQSDAALPRREREKKARERAKMTARRDQRATFDLPPALRQRIMELAITERLPASQLVTLALARFLREHAPRLSHEAILLYFFLAAVSDKDGLSFYGDASIAVRLRMGEAVVVRARDELVAADLVAYRAPLAQVLSLPVATVQRRGGGLASFGEILRSLTDSPSPSPPRRSP